MKDNKLYIFFKIYFQEALNVLDNASQKGMNIPDLLDEEPQFDIKNEGGHKNISYRFIQVFEKDHGRFISRNWNLLKELKSYKECLKYLGNNNFMRNSIEEQGFLLNTIVKYVKEAKQFKFSQMDFDENYKQIEEYIFSDVIKHTYSARLSSFESDSDEIVIDEFAKIKKFTVEECKERWKRSFFSRSIINIINPLDYRIEIIFYKKKEELRSNAGESQEDLKRILLLLRLFKSSDLKIGAVETKPIQWVPFGGITFTGNEESFGGKYTLNVSELPLLIELWKVIKNINFKNCPSLEIAIHRFSFVHERNNLEDKLIDTMVGFESLYLTDDKELRYKSALRTAILIGESPDEREKIFKIMQVAYDMRSTIIHGGKIVGKVKVGNPVSQEFITGQFIKILKDYLSTSIIKFSKLSTRNKSEEILNKIHSISLRSNFILS